MQTIFLGSVVRHLPLAVVAIALAGCGGDGGSPGTTIGTSNQPAAAQSTLAGSEQLVNTAAASLSGTQEAPTTQSKAQGTGTVTVDPTTRQLVATLTISGTVASSVQVQAGAPGTNGQPVFALTEAGPGSGVWSATLTLTQQQLDMLLTGNWYFNVLNSAFPHGEIRGQIVPQASVSSSFKLSTGSAGFSTISSLTEVLGAALRGSQETPPTASGARGSGAVLVDSNTRLMIAAVTTTGIKGTEAHILAGAPGISGPVVLALTEAIPGSGVWSARTTLTEAQNSALLAGGWYFEVSSMAFPAGEIRGQILPLTVTVKASPASPPAVTGTNGMNTGTGSTGISGMNTGLLNNNTGISGMNTGTGGINTGISGMNTGTSGTNTGISGINTGTGANTGTSGMNTGTGTGTGSINTGPTGMNNTSTSTSNSSSGSAGLL